MADHRNDGDLEDRLLSTEPLCAADQLHKDGPNTNYVNPGLLADADAKPSVAPRQDSLFDESDHELDQTFIS